MSKTHHRWLKELTQLPTAAGREGRVVQWVERWAARRPNVVLLRDKFGNLTLKHRDDASRKPILFTAHLDHPAFVVQEAVDQRTLIAEFRGGVRESFFKGTAVQWHPSRGKAVRGTVVEVADAKTTSLSGLARPGMVTLAFDRNVKAKPGDVVTWDVGPSEIVGDRLYAPACDDLAGAAAVFAAFDVLLKSRKSPRPPVRLLLTRSEEVGFIGAIAACKAGTIPRAARVIALENSKSFAESPIGGGPIVRVGDFTSTFDPDLTYRISRIAGDLAKDDPTFKWQRKLMTGGTCEASAYQSYGYTATCLCLPLGNYHNMNEGTGRIDRETISLGDFDGLVRLLIATAEKLDDAKAAPSLKTRLEALFMQKRALVDAPVESATDV